MTISTRRRRKRLRNYTIAGAALLCALGAALFLLLRRGPAQAASAPVATASPSPSPSASPGPAPTPSPTAAPTPTPARTPAPTLPLRKSALGRSLYQAALTISGRRAEGAVSLTYVNNGVDTLYALYLHLYPNAQAPGSLQIKEAALDGTRAYHTLVNNGALLHVPLVNELRSGEAARVYVEFTVDIPREGFGPAPAESGAIPLWGLVPTIAVYENEWLRTATPGQVDYAPLADWRVLVRAEGVPSLEAGQVEDLGAGRYLCTAKTAELALRLAS